MKAPILHQLGMLVGLAAALLALLLAGGIVSTEDALITFVLLVLFGGLARLDAATPTLRQWPFAKHDHNSL